MFKCLTYSIFLYPCVTRVQAPLLTSVKCKHISAFNEYNALNSVHAVSAVSIVNEVNAVNVVNVFMQ